ncbi:YgaP family membrane protein [Aquabacterium sp.]|uniref:YgaP family membrane protein n=1 Tax=Aquabacterium sp. TaxID=1872578 RepID=UPI0040381365
MKANVGGLDRAARITVGVVLVALAATGPVGVWGWIGLVPIATGLSGWCPAYLPFGISTCKLK